MESPVHNERCTPGSEGGARKPACVERARRRAPTLPAGSADEVRAALRVAEAFGYLEPAAIEEPLQLVDRVLAMLWRLTR